MESIWGQSEVRCYMTLIMCVFFFQTGHNVYGYICLTRLILLTISEVKGN